ncbi:MAG: hypothetical protein MZV64_08650 [Ignavibacteriales bacterium]|nr:hypothetical protein [Ignavibacteriales bacterium]
MAELHLPIWAMFMEGAYKELKLPVTYFSLADGVEIATFCKESMNLGDAKLATDACPETYTDLVDANKMPAIVRSIPAAGAGSFTKTSKAIANGKFNVQCII